jgi:hypothetical protein
VLGALLCDEPDPPPPGIPALAETNGSAVNTRAILAEHRANPACAGCHDAIDPIGLAMERWDPIGRYRPAELQGMIDESGGLPDGTPVVGITELQRAIAADPAFLRCATEKLYTWAHHRVPGPDDAAWIEALTTTYEADGGSLGALIRAIVRSPTFRSREVRP